MQPSTDDLVWYVAYGSNMAAARFSCYLRGGRPTGAGRTYRGCRDGSPPRDSTGVRLRGGIRFAGLSSVWGGGMAFYDPGLDTELAARAYLVTFAQFSDVVAQETRRPVGADLRLGDTTTPRRWPAPSQVYESVLHLGDRDERPMLTITSLQDHPAEAPSAAYLRTLLGGLGETFDWSASARASYLMAAAGVRLGWDHDALVGLCHGAGDPQEQ